MEINHIASKGHVNRSNMNSVAVVSIVEIAIHNDHIAVNDGEVLINHPLFKICLDTGHCAVFGESPADAVRLIGKEYLRVLHVHDNDGKNDRHWLPYNGVIDWADFSLALAEIGYEGTLSLETRAPARIPADILEPQEIALFHMGKKLANR